MPPLPPSPSSPHAPSASHDRPDENAWRSRDDEAIDAILSRGGTPPPPTFAMRGVAVPFTTPTLALSRMRKGGKGGMPELIVPNAVGARGWYVVPWDGVPALAPLTLHDRVLHANLATQALPSPEGVRAAARGAALSGLAGRAAMAAAASAEASERRLRERAQAECLGRLVAAASGRRGQIDPVQAGDHRAALTIEAIAARAKQPASRLFEALDRMVEALAPLGGLSQAAEAPLPAALRAVVQLRAALEDRAERAETDAARVAAHLVKVLLLFERCARRTLASAYAATGDVAMVLVRWHRSDCQAPALLHRPAWVLDGWPELAAFWQAAHAAHEPERPTLARLLQLTPSLPAEAEAWTGEKVPRAQPELRGVSETQDWRDQALLLVRTARLEAVRALVP